jgi:ABC-type multidrug transport system fused ATPase/permease subunit
MKTFKWPILAPIFPLLCIVALTVSQPLLIQQFMNHLNTPDDGSEKQRNIGYGLVAAYGLVFISVAVRCAYTIVETCSY